MAKILIVDDEEDIRELLMYNLKREGHEVSGAENGIAALAQVKISRPDLIILDVMMPQMDGIGLLREVRVLLPEVEAIVASGRMDDEQMGEIRRLGVKSCLDKPFTRAGLIEALRGALGKAG